MTVPRRATQREHDLGTTAARILFGRALVQRGEGEPVGGPDVDAGHLEQPPRVMPKDRSCVRPQKLDCPERRPDRKARGVEQLRYGEAGSSAVKRLQQLVGAARTDAL